MGLLFWGCWSLQLMTSVNSTTIFQREWSSPMHHNSEFQRALGDETGKQQAAITPHTGGPEQRLEGEGTWKHWLGQLSSCLAQQNNHPLHPHTSCLGSLPKRGKLYRKSRGLLGLQGLSTLPDQFRFMAEKAAGLSPVSSPCTERLAENACPIVPQQSSGEPHAAAQTPHCSNRSHNSYMTLYTSFSFSFHPSIQKGVY